MSASFEKPSESSKKDSRNCLSEIRLSGKVNNLSGGPDTSDWLNCCINWSQKRFELDLCGGPQKMTF